ncbi:hypothetical protein CBL_06697 [Carabus blaptoides fortunei]
MEREGGGCSMTTLFKGLKIICSLIAFICAMIIGFPWQIGIVAFFNIMQLVILIYAVVAVIMRVALRIQVGNWWKYDCIITIVLACLEFAATTTWAVAAQVNYTSLTAMVAFGYLTGIVCIVSASHLILSM